MALYYMIDCRTIKISKNIDRKKKMNCYQSIILQQRKILLRLFISHILSSEWNFLAFNSLNGKSFYLLLYAQVFSACGDCQNFQTYETKWKPLSCDQIA